MPRSPLRRRRSLPSVTWASLSAAVMSAVLVNPLDVAKTRLQAQAAGVVYNPIWSDFRCYPSCNPGGINGLRPSCSPECFQYRGTMDVFSKVTRQEGIFRLWRGTGASVALAVPMVGIYLPSYDLLRNWIEEYAPLISGSIARSLACIACSPIELARTRMQAFNGSNIGGKPPGMWKTLLGVLSSRQSISSPETFGDTTSSGLVWEHNLHVMSPSRLYAGPYLNQLEDT